MRIRLKNVLCLRDQKKLNCMAHTVIWLNKFCPYWPWMDGWILRFAGKPLPVCKRNHRANTRFLQRFLMDQIIPDSIRWFRKAKQHGWLENNREMAWKRRHRLHRRFHRRASWQETEHFRPPRLSSPLHHCDERSCFDSSFCGRPAGQSRLVRTHILQTNQAAWSCKAERISAT